MEIILQGVSLDWFYKQYGNFDTDFKLIELVLVCHIVNEISLLIIRESLFTFCG